MASSLTTQIVQLKSERYLSHAIEKKCKQSVMLFTSVENSQAIFMCHGDMKQFMLALYKKKKILIQTVHSY